MDSGRIYVNLEGREPLGCIREGDERNSLSRDIVEGLLRLRDPRGGYALQEVHHRDDVYTGPFVESGPDLVVQTVAGIDPKAGLRSGEVFGRARSRGMHSFGDAVLISNQQVPHEPEIKDCFGLLLGS
jgi:predicted AlkP superfamily phosphohydrolase/phosphomutase